MKTQEASDAQLAARALAGEEAAFTIIVKRHKLWLYQFIRRNVPAEDSQDVLQESLIAAWNGLHSYDRSRPMHHWLRRIALNKCRDRARRLMVRNFLRPWPLSPVELEEVADPMLTADENLFSNERLQWLRNAIDELPRQLKETLLLTVIDDLSHAEVSEILGITPKAVEGRIHRARKRLCDIMRPAPIETTDVGPTLALAF